MSQASAGCIRRMVYAITEVSARHIRFPTPEEKCTIMQAFSTKAGMPGCMHMLDWRNFHPIRECSGDGAEFYHGHKRCCKLAWQCTRLKNFQWVSLPDSSDRPSLRLLFWWWWLSLPLLSPYSIYQSKGTTWGKIRSDSHKNPQLYREDVWNI